MDDNGGHGIPTADTASFDEPALFAASAYGFDARYLPTTKDRRFTKLELTLGSGRLVIATRPPMLFEGAVSAEGGVISFQLEGNVGARVNGASANGDTVSARGWPESASGNRILWIGAESGANLRSCAADVTDVIRSDPARIANPNVLKGMDQSILVGLDDALSTFVLPAASIATGRYLAICRRARDYLREDDFRVQSNVEVAGACGVHVRTLHNAFVSVLGVSLREYLLLHRLWLVRGALLRAGPNELVKSIALDHGFWHLGRFSRLYHSRFGESPSTTLAKGSTR